MTLALALALTPALAPRTSPWIYNDALALALKVVLTVTFRVELRDIKARRADLPMMCIVACRCPCAR